MSFNDLSSAKNAPPKDKPGDQIKVASAAGEPSARPNKTPAREPSAQPNKTPAREPSAQPGKTPAGESAAPNS